MKDIELRIWDYIDGVSTENERANIEQLLRTDVSFKAKYEELYALNQDFGLMELDAPSMAFANKVMDKIDLQTKPLSAKAKTDKKIIYFISSLFGLMMLACVIVVISHIDWNVSSPTNEYVMPNFGQIFNVVRISNGFFNNVFYGFFMFDVIVGLMLLDGLMREKSAIF